MRILITGGAGCLGSNLTERYLAAGPEVLVIDNFATGHRGSQKAGVRRFVNFHTALGYGWPDSVPIPVDAPARPFTSYGITPLKGYFCSRTVRDFVDMDDFFMEEIRRCMRNHVHFLPEVKQYIGQ